MSDEIEIGLRVLDRQLLDRDGRRCGNVDDLAIEGGVDDVPEVVGHQRRAIGRLTTVNTKLQPNS